MVGRDKQEEILLPPTKNRTFPAVLTLTVTVIAIPLMGVPEIVGAVIWLDSLVFVIVIVRVCVSESAPSETATTST